MPDEVLLAEAAFVALVHGAWRDQFACRIGERREIRAVREVGGEQQRRFLLFHPRLQQVGGGIGRGVVEQLGKCQRQARVLSTEKYSFLMEDVTHTYLTLLGKAKA